VFCFVLFVLFVLFVFFVDRVFRGHSLCVELFALGEFDPGHGDLEQAVEVRVET